MRMPGHESTGCNFWSSNSVAISLTFFAICTLFSELWPFYVNSQDILCNIPVIPAHHVSET